MDINEWIISTNSLNHEDRRLCESLTSLGNGYMGVRGNFEETYSLDMHLGSYIAGIWYPDKTRVGWWKNGYPEYFGKVINALNFFKMQIIIDGTELDLAKIECKDFKISLNMYEGILYREFSALGVHFKITKFLSIDQKELAFLKYEISAQKDCEIKLISHLDADVKNEDSNYDHKFWDLLDLGASDKGAFITTRTIKNPFGIEQFIVHADAHFKSDLPHTCEHKRDMSVQNCFKAALKAGDKKSFEKRIIITTSRDYKEQDISKASAQISAKIEAKAGLDLIDAHKKAWAKRWEIADVKITGDDRAQQGMRYNIFQLFSTYYGDDARLNIGPKGFSGKKYGGATYWDTEAYALPLYLGLADKNVALNLLKYRHAQLDGAKQNARLLGLNGALYPMVTFNGIECHNEWEITFEEIHRNGAIAYAIYNYTNYTGDTSYLQKEGLEVLIEIARFFASRVHFSKRAGKYMIHGVTGPNEYENNINNNFHTNMMAKFVLDYTSECLARFGHPTNGSGAGPAGFDGCGVTRSEVESWSEISNNIYLPYDAELGIFVQHDGFLDKDLQKAADLPQSERPLNQRWSWDRILRSCFIKQADVLQSIYFLNNKFSLEEKRANFYFYEPMTVHESSLSPCVHGILASELGDMTKAYEMFNRTARLDLDNVNNDTEDGLHITSMSGSWLVVAHGFAQMKTFDSLSFAPKIPKEWQGYSFHINYRNRLIKIAVTKESATFSLLRGEPLEFKVYDKTLKLDKIYETKLQ